MALIVVISSLEEPPAPPYKWTHIDKVYHLVEYSILGFLAFRAFRWGFIRMGLSPALVLLVTALFCVAFGMTDEIHQRYVAKRHASLGDLAADSVGTLIGIGAGCLALAFRRGRGENRLADAGPLSE